MRKPKLQLRTATNAKPDADPMPLPPDEANVPPVVAEARRRAAEKRKSRELSEFRRAIFRAVIELEAHAYGNMIHQQLKRYDPASTTSFGQVYGALRRMEADGYLTSYAAESSIPGARGVTVYELTDKARQLMKS